VVGLLWLKRRLPRYAARFVDMTLVLCADHGPAVSGAHVAIVTARAGKVRAAPRAAEPAN
jgi:ATP citrate (pro-S)-lyase